LHFQKSDDSFIIKLINLLQNKHTWHIFVVLEWPTILSSQKDGELMSKVRSSVWNLKIFGLVDGLLLILGWASLGVEHRGGFFHPDENLFSFVGGLSNFKLDDSLLVLELLGFSELDLLESLLNFGDVSIVSLGLLSELLMLNLALEETLVMLVEEIFCLDSKFRLLDFAKLLSFFDLLSNLLGFLDF
jgi:predicted HTH domain antitoxin